VLLVVLAAAAPARAHIELMRPIPRTLELKIPPCGLARIPRGFDVTVYKPGQTIEVVWQETIAHPGHYRISFDADGDDDFVDPRSFTDLNTAPSVMIDDIPDRTGNQIYRQMVTLPDIECGNCTLQVIQVMTDKPPYGDGDDVYHQCADLVITSGDGGVPRPPDAGSTPGDDGGGACGCSAGRRGGSGVSGVSGGAIAGALLVLALSLARRRRGVAH